MSFDLWRELESVLGYSGDKQKFLQLLPRIHNPASVKVDGNSIIYLAARRRWWDVVRQLCTQYQCVPTDSETIGGDTILHWACFCNADIVKHLTTDFCLDPLQKNSFGYTPLDYSSGATRQYLQHLIDDSKKEGFENVIDFLKKKKEERDTVIGTALAEGSGDLFQYNIVLHGPPGAGKSSLKRVMIGQDPLPKWEHTATNIVENAVRTISIDKLNKFAVIGNDELINMLAEKVNTHCSGDKSKLVEQCNTQGNETQAKTDAFSKNDSTPLVPSSNTVSIIPPKTSSLLSIKERLDRATGPVKIYDSNWHHVIDSGGQPQFTDIFPLVYHNPSLNVVVIRLTEDLDDKPMVCYYEEGKDIYALPDRLLLSNRELIIRMCQIASSQCISGSVFPYVMIVGTHLDKLGSLGETKVREINRGLIEIKQHFSNVLICKGEGETIFPINTMAEGEKRKEYTKELQECITSVTRQHVSPVKVPLRWLVYYQLDLDKDEGVVTMEECYNRGDALGMKKIDVESALRFFTKISLILYFPDDIPDLILTKVDPLISRLSKLVKSSFIPPKFCPPAASERLRTKGLFNSIYLAKVLSNLESKALSNEKFLMILQCLKIIVRVGRDDYFLPSALSLEPINEQSIFKISSNPLVFSWGECFLPHGFFFTVAVELLSRNGDYRFELRTDIAQWRGEIQVREATGKIPGVVKLTNNMKWIQISSSSTARHCPAIYKEVDVAVQKSITRFQHTGIGPPVVTSLCPLCESSDHYCLLSSDKKELTCAINNSVTGPVNQEISCWFDGDDAINSSTLGKLLPSKDTMTSRHATPKLNNIYHLLRSKSSKWQDIGRELCVDYDYRTSLERQGVMKTDECKLEDVLAKWMESHCSEVSWDNLIQVLECRLGFVDVAREIRKCLCTD